MNAFCAWAWIQRGRETRAVTVTPAGWEAFREHFGIESEALEAPKPDFNAYRASA